VDSLGMYVRNFGKWNFLILKNFEVWNMESFILKNGNLSMLENGKFQIFYKNYKTENVQFFEEFKTKNLKIFTIFP